MLWKGRRRSDNIDDQRSAGGRARGVGGAKLGLGTLVLVVLVAWLLGADPRQLMQVVEVAQQSRPSPAPSPHGGVLPPAGQDIHADFVGVVLASTEDVWSEIFGAKSSQYPPPTLNLFTDSVGSACGYASAASGPFYCPRDREVYIDLAFFRELDERFGAPGDFAQAYVIAHEVGHHVQEVLGVNADIKAMERGQPEEVRNQLSVAVELQADCLAGVWAHHSQRQNRWFEEGDVEEGLAAAAAIGDDRIQRDAGVRVSPETWTHGSSAQRVQWFRRGLETGEIGACDTLSGG